MRQPLCPVHEYERQHDHARRSAPAWVRKDCPIEFNFARPSAAQLVTGLGLGPMQVDDDTAGHLDLIRVGKLLIPSSTKAAPLARGSANFLEAAKWSDADLAKLLPRRIDGSLSSVGAFMHESGECRPCIYAHRPNGCAYGIRCKFCHLEHKSSGRKARQKKRKTTTSPCETAPATCWRPTLRAYKA